MNEAAPDHDVSDADALHTSGAGAATTPATCQTCNCCFGILVDVTGLDVWRLATALSLAPSDFVETCPSEETDDDIGVMLEPGGETFTLVLRRQTTQACTFLLGPIGDRGLYRCGPYDHRPAACRSYPAEIAEPGAPVRVRSVARCPVGTDLSDAPWRTFVRDEQILIDIHRLVVWRWNRHVLTTGETFDLDAYLGYLLEVHDRLEPAWQALTERDDWAEGRERWGATLDEGASPFFDDEPSLQAWMDDARALIGVIERSFPNDPSF